MLTAPSEDTVRRSLKLLVTGVIAMIVVIVLGIVLSTVQTSWASLQKQLKSGPVPQYTAGDWAIRTLGDASVEAPFQFGPGPDVRQQVPADVREAMIESESFRSQAAPKSFNVVMSRGVFTADVAFDLDSAAHGSLSMMAKVLGDNRPSIEIKPARISGREARMATYHYYTRSGFKSEEAHILAAFVTKNSRMWQIFVAYHDESLAADAERILKSFKIR